MLGSCGLSGRVVTRLPWWLCALETQVEVARPHTGGSASPLPHSPAGEVGVLSLTGHTGPQAQLNQSQRRGDELCGLAGCGRVAMPHCGAGCRKDPPPEPSLRLVGFLLTEGPS